ncbi:MAG: hypothetical protein WBA74_08120 [Cyclobacteriaceae bacterium]
MKYFVIIILPFLANTISAQEKLLSGGFRVNNSQTYTRITAHELDDDYLFRISSIETVSRQIVQFKVTANSIQSELLIEEGGSAIVEAKSLAVSRKFNGDYAYATWEVVDDNRIANVVPWKFFPRTTSKITVASLEEEKLFVISINLRSNNCSNGRMQLFIDGVAVKDDSGNILRFPEGSSVIGKGRLIQLVVTGSCSETEGFSGSLKLEK